MIEALTVAAHEEIERAAGEAARAAAVEVAGEQAALLVEARAVALRWENEAGRLREGRLKLALTVGGVTFSVGVLVGAGTILLLRGLR